MTDIRIISGDAVSENHIKQALDLDRLSYGDEYQLQFDTCKAYFYKNNRIYLMAVDEHADLVVGYINFSPIRSEAFDLLRSGQYIDTILTAEDVVPYTPEEKCYGYFSSIVVHPKYRCQGIANTLLIQLKNLITNLAIEEGIYFKAIIADAVSDLGFRLLSKIGYVEIGDSNHGSQIMVLDLSSQNIKTNVYNDTMLEAYKTRRRSEYGF